jgi:hypothetical protein
MITQAIFSAIFGTISALLSWLPNVDLRSLPVVGNAVFSVLTYAVGTWNAFLSTFPYAILPWHIFLYAILPFEGLMLLLKLVLGHRLPSHQN